MKKNLLYVALAALCLTGLTACGSDNDDAPQTTSVSDFDYESDLTIEGEFIGAEEPKTIVDIVLTRKGMSFYNEFQKVQTRAGGSTKYKKGLFSYNKTKSEYTLMDSGKRPICTISLKDTRSSSSAQATFFFPGDPTPYIANVTVTENEIPAGELADIMCRSWKVAGARLRHSDGVTAVKQFQVPEAASLNAILDYAKTKATIDEEFDPGMTVTDITLTRSGKFIISFENGKSFVADDWSWLKVSTESGTFSFEWEDPQTMHTEFEDGIATFDIRPFGQKNYYTLTLGSTIKPNDGSKPYKVELSFYLEENI